jgi:hypothetical protein
MARSPPSIPSENEPTELEKALKAAARRPRGQTDNEIAADDAGASALAEDGAPPSDGRAGAPAAGRTERGSGEG